MEDSRKRALLLHYAGERVYDIFEAETLSSNSGDTSEYATTKSVLIKYFEPHKNVQMEIYKFRQCVQKEGQYLDDFVTQLRQLSKD